MKISVFLLSLMSLVTFKAMAIKMTTAQTAPMKMCNPELVESCFQDRAKANHGFIITNSNTNKAVKTKYVALLIHGLSDSPYFYRDIAQILFNKGINVVAIRTTGHGTDESHLGQITKEQWYKDVSYGVKLAKKYGNNVIVAGMSNGGSLALRETQRNKDIKGLLLFSAALKTPKKYKVSCALTNKVIKRPLQFLGGLFTDTSDYQATKEYGVGVRYQGIHNNGTCQLYKMNAENHKFAVKNRKKIARRKISKLYSDIKVPVFSVVSEYDGVLNLDYMMNFSHNVGSNKEGKSFLVLYKDPSQSNDWNLPQKTFTKEVECMNHASTLLRPSPEMGYSKSDYLSKCSYTDSEIELFNQEKIYDYTPETNFHFEIMEQALNEFIDQNYLD